MPPEEFLNELPIKSIMILPNIVISGTPGVGKTSLCQMLISKLKETGDERLCAFKHVNLSEIIKMSASTDQFSNGSFWDFGCDYDSEYDSYTFDEDKVCDYFEEELGICDKGNFRKVSKIRLNLTNLFRDALNQLING